ncbi:MAG: LytR C-terminal domain-containing protein [Dermatophilaceae bacterium]
MDQLHESGASIHRRRRRRRAAVTLILVALVLLGTFTYAAAYFQGWVGTRSPKTVASPSCQVATPVEALTPRTVTVNVYNSTNRAGLAASVAKSLRTQGFKVVDVANDPLGRSISGVGEIRHGRAGAAAATLAATRLPGAKLVLDNRTDATVDLVLGTKFTVLSVPPKVAPAQPSKPAPSPSTSC